VREGPLHPPPGDKKWMEVNQIYRDILMIYEEIWNKFYRDFLYVYFFSLVGIFNMWGPTSFLLYFPKISLGLKK
jgi:hypothetical protein